jgi:hypothetical protein
MAGRSQAGRSTAKGGMDIYFEVALGREGLLAVTETADPVRTQLPPRMSLPVRLEVRQLRESLGALGALVGPRSSMAVDVGLKAGM